MDAIALSRGVPDPDILPLDRVRAITHDVLDNHGVEALSYGGPLGCAPLREVIADWHDVDPQRVLITNGSLQALALVLSVALRERGDQVIVEVPTYDRPIDLMRRTGHPMRGVTLTGTGLDLDELAREAAADASRLLYTIPSFHNPGGVTQTDSVRDGIMHLADEHDLLIFEDDPYGLLGFNDPPPATLLSRDTSDRVLYASSFSKTISPGLRAGYLIMPERMAGELQGLAASSWICPNMLTGWIVNGFVRDPGFEDHLASVRRELSIRCDAMCDALDEYLPETSWNRPGGGYFLWLKLPEGLDSDLLAVEADRAGVSFVSGSDFGAGCDDCVRLAFSPVSPDRVREAIERLARAVHALHAAS